MVGNPKSVLPSGIGSKLNTQLSTTKLQLASANSKVSTLTAETTDLASKLAAADITSKQLSDQLAAIQSNAAVTQTSLDLVVNHSSRFTVIEGPHTTDYLVAVNVTLTNNTKTPIDVAASGFQLKDSSNNTYPGYAGYTQQKLGIGYVDIAANQTIQPGDAVTGTITFNVVDHNITSYTLVNGPNKYPVDATAWTE